MGAVASSGGFLWEEMNILMAFSVLLRDYEDHIQQHKAYIFTLSLFGIAENITPRKWSVVAIPVFLDSQTL